MIDRAAIACLTALAVLVPAVPAAAQSYPNRPIRVIVTTSPGRHQRRVRAGAVGAAAQAPWASRWWSRTAPAAS